MATIPLSGMLIIPSRFNGPPGSGNGGFACGLVSQLIDGLAEVTLRSPPPLDTEMDVAHVPGGIEVLDGNTLVATARQIDPWALSYPDPPSLEAARAAREHYRGHTVHEFPTCFTCGPDREDGIGIFPGPVGGGVVASSWTADESLPSHAGFLATEVVWAALDCPGAWATARIEEGAIVLGRMAAVIMHPVEVGAEYVSYGWTDHEEGRKTFAGTAIADAEGRVLAVAKQTWIAV
jgi:hypothetical protein